MFDLRNDGGTVEIAELTTAEISALRGTLAQRRARLRAALATQRWARTQVFAYGGVPDAPADGALAAVSGVVIAAMIEPPSEPITWKLADGEFRAWSIDQIKAYGIAIRSHIQACFDREAELSAAIGAASSHSALDAIDLTVGWPS